MTYPEEPPESETAPPQSGKLLQLKRVDWHNGRYDQSAEPQRRLRHLVASTVWILTLAVTLTSCSTAPSVRELTRPIADSRLVQALVPDDHLPKELRDYLDAEGLHRIYHDSPAEAVRLLLARHQEAPTKRSLTLLARICGSTGEKVRKKKPLEAIGFYLDAASLAIDDAILTAHSSKETPLRIVYNHSSRSIARLLSDEGRLNGETIAIQGPIHDYSIHVRSEQLGLISPSFVDSMLPADYLEFKGLDHLTRIRQPGLGGRLVGHRNGSEERRTSEPLLHPQAGLSIPITATLDFDSAGQRQAVELTLHDTLVSQETTLHGSTVPLATDLTAPLAILYNYTEKDVGLKNLIDPRRSESVTGLFQMEPFRTDQIPVVFVHGLKSSPHVWLEALNKLRSDPVLRDRYQLLVFSYPTGYPISYNATSLRKHLKEFRDTFNVDGGNPVMQNMIVIGHSMGGILSNYQIRDSGQTLNDVLFDRPLDEIDFTEEQKDALRPHLYFEANPDIKRVIFITVPHRGSKLALGVVGAIGRALIKLPIDFLYAEPLHYVDGMTQQGRKLVKDRPNSVYSLKPGSLALSVVWQLPNPYQVPLHSIIAQVDPTIPLEESSDAVVPYSSSHVDGVESEFVVKGEDHSTVNTSDQAILELRRLLYLHIGEQPPH